MIQYFFLILLILITYLSAFKNNIPTCDRFIQNVYLYLATAICLLGVLVNSMPITMSRYFIHAIVVSFMSLILLVTFNKSILINHILWIIFIASISIIMLPYIHTSSYIQSSIISTCIIFILMTMVGIKYKSFFNKYTNQFSIGLFIALIAIIITEIMLIITDNYKKNKSIMSYLVIILFSIFIAYDTNRLAYYAKTCVKSPNYPQHSTHLFLDIINIFIR